MVCVLFSPKLTVLNPVHGGVAGLRSGVTEIAVRALAAQGLGRNMASIFLAGTGTPSVHFSVPLTLVPVSSFFVGSPLSLSFSLCVCVSLYLLNSLFFSLFSFSP